MFLNFWLLLLLFLSSLLGCGNNSVTLEPVVCFLTENDFLLWMEHKFCLTQREQHAERQNCCHCWWERLCHAGNGEAVETHCRAFGAWAAGPLGQGRGAAAPKNSWYLFSAPGRRILPSCHPENDVWSDPVAPICLLLWSSSLMSSEASVIFKLISNPVQKQSRDCQIYGYVKDPCDLYSIALPLN